VNNEPTRLIMYGAYGMLAESAFDYKAFFEAVQPYGVNAVRVWVNFHWANDRSPFAKSGDKADLLHWSDGYFTRLKNFVDAADQRGIVVQLCLFDGVMLETKGNRWNWSPYRDSQNLDSITYIKDDTSQAPTQHFKDFLTTADDPSTRGVENRVWTN